MALMIATRRKFLLWGLAGAGLMMTSHRAGWAGEPGRIAVAEITPNEDLMQEHGLLVRLLLIYEELRARLVEERPAPGKVLGETADLFMRLGHDYHEKLEEDYVFPRLQGGELSSLTDVLSEQHQASRQVTARLQEMAKGDLSQESRRQEAARLMRAQSRVYLPHLAREDTVVFPAFHAGTPKDEYRKLGEQFEAQEDKALGEKGFSGAVARTADLEKELGINDLSKFTPA